jgi:uncharacterized protein (TIGR02145 family)
MAENLRTATYANSEPIPNENDNTAWTQLSSGAWCNYGNNVSNDEVYGKLYNWYTTVDPRGLCPAGWHVPTDEEWTELTDYLGGTSVAGGKMKSITGWVGNNIEATNESDFSGLPGGGRDFDGFFASVGYNVNWWSSSDVNAYAAWNRFLFYFNGSASRYMDDKRYGFSVRCIKE